jgi:hypothetical protein
VLVLKRDIHNPLEIRRWFPPDLRVGTLFIPDTTDLTVGQEICVWLVLPSLQVDLYLVGTVVFRRLRAGGSGSVLHPGAGLALRPGQQAELAFLQRLLTQGTGPIAMRRFVRTPLLIPWEARVEVPHLNMWSPAILTEISLGGARIQFEPMPLHSGARVSIGLPWHSSSHHELQLAWFRLENQKVLAGLSRPLAHTMDQRDWEELVRRAMEHFRARVRIT